MAAIYPSQECRWSGGNKDNIEGKDALIVSLEAAIKSKDVQIARRNESARGIAAAHKQVKDFADESERAQLFRGRAEGFLDALTIIGSRLQEMPQLFPSAPYSTRRACWPSFN